MLLVKTRLGQSAIEGIGLFAAEFIPAGTVVWRAIPEFDRSYTTADLDGLPETARAQLLRYCYTSKESGRLILCADDARFMNHSDEANCFSPPGPDDSATTVALRDIAIGEEMTDNYFTFDADAQRSLPAVRR